MEQDNYILSIRKVFLITILLLTAFAADAQKRPLNPAPTFDDIEAKVYTEKLKYCYSKEGIKNWKPEVTARMGLTLFYGGYYAGTIGVRVNDRSTFGLMGLSGSFYYDAYPAHSYWAGGAIYVRRTLPLGRRAIVSVSNELTAGAGYFYKVTGDQDILITDPDGNEFVYEGFHDVKAGDILPLIGWQPTLKIRIYRNFHIFLGANISTYGNGPVLGIGL